MGKLYNSVMVRCTTLLEKFFKRSVDLEFHLLSGANDGLPIGLTAEFWQSPQLGVEPKLPSDSNATTHWAVASGIDGTADMHSS
jgi:hypothetical protein